MGASYLAVVMLMGLSFSMCNEWMEGVRAEGIVEFVTAFNEHVGCKEVEYLKFNYENLLEYWDAAHKTFGDVTYNVSAEVMVGLVSFLRPALETLALTEIRCRDGCIMAAINRAKDMVNKKFFDDLMDTYEKVYEALQIIYASYKKGEYKAAGGLAGDYFHIIFNPK